MTGLGPATDGNPHIHPEVRTTELTSATRPRSIAGNLCVRQDARNHTESRAVKTRNDDAGDDCCNVADPLMPRTARATRRSGSRKMEKKKFLKANPCCSQDGCSEGRREEEVNVLVAKESSGAICTVAEGEWVEVEVAIDSGATETVMAAETLNGIVDITEGPACRRGVTYEVANGVEIPNLGARKILGFTEYGGQRGITAQVCAVNNTLVSVGKVAAQGNREGRLRRRRQLPRRQSIR